MPRLLNKDLIWFMQSFSSIFFLTLRAEPPFVFVSEEALPKSRQTFEVAAAQTSGLLNLVPSRQTGFSRVRASVFR